jgi:large subunit ribosomal protein L23
MYGVNALKVRIINVKPRKVRVGRFQGTSPGFKKAIVKLQKGQKIDSLSA